MYAVQTRIFHLRPLGAHACSIKGNTSSLATLLPSRQQNCIAAGHMHMEPEPLLCPAVGFHNVTLKILMLYGLRFPHSIPKCHDDLTVLLACGIRGDQVG
jgi:hypothetical protein